MGGSGDAAESAFLDEIGNGFVRADQFFAKPFEPVPRDRFKDRFPLQLVKTQVGKPPGHAKVMCDIADADGVRAVFRNVLQGAFHESGRGRQGVRIACPSDRVIRNAVFRDITFKGRNAIFADQQRWYLEAGNTGNITTSNVLFENWKIDCRGFPISVVVTDGVTLRDFGHMTFRNIEIKAALPIKICGNATTVVRDIALENVSGRIKANPPLVKSNAEDVRISGFRVNE